MTAYCILKCFYYNVFAVTLTVILLFVNGTFAIMIYQLTKLALSRDVFTDITNRFDAFVNKTENFLYTTDNIHILSLLAAALIVVSVFFAVLYIGVKLFAFVCSIGEKKKSTENKKDEPEQEPEPEAEDSALASELQSELDKSDKFLKPSLEKLNADALVIEQENKIQTAEEDTKETHLSKKENPAFALDWQKSSINKANGNQDSRLVLKKNIRDLICMIVNMLGHNIDELKIAQALMFRCKEDWSEEAILQLVRAIKEFLDLCNQAAFDNVRRLKDLPSDEECILRLIAGDASYAMALLEALLDDRINQAVALKNADKRHEIFQQAAQYSCCFGTLAEINDAGLAAASFELAIEMCPDSTVAWSRCAEVYRQNGQVEKANWAYRNVLKLAQQNNDAQQEANANKFLSQYLYDLGDSVKASQLYMQSKNYYDSIGINRPLDRKELEILEQIDSSDSEKIIQSVLGIRQNLNSL